MRIGLILPALPSLSETFFRSKVEGLQNKGHDVLIFVDRTGRPQFDLCRAVESYPISSYSVIRMFQVLAVLSLTLIKVPRAVSRFVALEHAEGNTFPSIIKRLYLNAHILPHSVDWLHFGFATTVIGKENTAKAIIAKMSVSFRGFDVSIYPVTHGNNCFHHIWSKIDKVHFISDDLLALARDKLGLPDSIPVAKIRPALDVERFKPRQRQQRLPDPVHLLTVARYHWKKGLDYAIEAAARLKRDGLRFHYLIVGEGEAYQNLRYLIHLLDVEDCVTLEGPRRHGEIASIMQKADIYLQPSVSEGFCNAALEAQASGLLCVVSDAEGLAENVLDEKTGWVVEKRNVEALTNKIRQIMALDPETLKQIREHARERIKNSFRQEQQDQLWHSFFTTNIHA